MTDNLAHNAESDAGRITYLRPVVNNYAKPSTCTLCWALVKRRYESAHTAWHFPTRPTAPADPPRCDCEAAGLETSSHQEWCSIYTRVTPPGDRDAAQAVTGLLTHGSTVPSGVSTDSVQPASDTTPTTPVVSAD